MASAKWRSRGGLGLILGIALIFVLGRLPLPALAQGYQVETVVEDVYLPWSLNFAPDGRLLFTSRDTGQFHALDLTTKQVETLPSDLSVHPGGEGGLLGMALDPDFATNGVLYVCYSTAQTETSGIYLPAVEARVMAVSAASAPVQAELVVNRLSRLVLSGSQITDEVVLVTMPHGPRHNGCRVLVSADGYLFITMGDASEENRAQDVNSLSGKILRINRDGSIPADNPWSGSPVWTLGHRNAQGLAFEPGTGRLWSTEHGPDTQDEINVIKRGRNYGWPICLGVQPSCPGVANYEPSVREFYQFETVATSDMVFYTGDAFPGWQGDILFVTLKTGRLYHLEVSGETVVSEERLVDGEYGRLRDVAIGPDGFIYFSTDELGQSKILRLKPA
jgi:aldose sugar dehydrogenase